MAEHVSQPVNLFLRFRVLSLGVHNGHEDKNNILEVHLDLLSQELSSLVDVQVSFHVSHDGLPLFKLIVHLIKFCIKLIFRLLLHCDALNYALG